MIEIEGRSLTLLPAFIDPHVHFRTPGATHKEDWHTGALAAIRGGITTVCDMPNNTPPCTTYEAVLAKKALIDSQLPLPLRYHLYLGADRSHLEEIALAKQAVCALKIYMGNTTGGLVMDDDAALEKAFYEAAKAHLVVAVHAEDEGILQRAKALHPGSDPALHSRQRPKEAAIAATEKAISLSAKYGTTLYIVHVSTQEEVQLIRHAKRLGLPVFAEATPHHLFLSEQDYASWGTFVQMNPPLRTKADQAALWEGLLDGTIDTLGTDHAPHTKEEKGLPFGQAPSGVPGVETLMPLMLNAVNQGLLSMERLLELCHHGSASLFGLPANRDVVLVDLHHRQEVRPEAMATKCGWTPYAGRTLQGWPAYTIIDDQVFCAALGTLKGKQEVEEILRETATL